MVKQKIRSNMRIIKYLIVFIIIFCVMGAFFVGLNWSSITLLSKRIIPTQLMCFGFNNLQETYQLNCYAPLTKNQKKYSFKDHLICKTITNHQFRTSDTKYQFESPKIYNEITSIKNDYSNFILDFDYGNNEIKSSSQPGEPKKDPFVIIQNDNNVVNAIRKTKLDNYFGYEYQYITLSKKTGKGSLTWTNTQDFDPHLDSFATEFFQCE
ncbi:MAG: hypothetical protein Q7R95_10880 [bacterium]|nr:hypothetical protein [bacterium]